MPSFPPQLKTVYHRIDRIAQDARLWVGLLFLVGLFFLNLPFHDDHQWRQAITATIARNLYEVSFHPFYPLYDICGEHSPAAFATEFPILPALMAAFYHVFGEQWWIGRLIVWVTSCLGLWYFARLVDRIVEPPAGTYATIAVMGSVALTFARKMMPDTFSVCLVIIGAFQLWLYLEKGKRKHLWWGVLWASLGVLAKVPAVVILCLLGIAFLRGEIPLNRKVITAGALLIPAALLGGWYFLWMPHLQEITRCPPLIYPVSLAEGWKILVEKEAYRTFMRFYDTAFYGYDRFFLFAAGVFVAVWRHQWRLLLAAAAYAALFFVFILKTGNIFAGHSYYVIPFVPLMALFIGILFKQKWLPGVLALALLFVAIAGPLRLTYKDIYLFPDLPELEIEKVLNELGSDRDDLVAINSVWGNPRYHYYAKRRGWIVGPKAMPNPDWIGDYKDLGLKYLIVIKKRYDEPLDYPLVRETEHFRYYDISEWERPVKE